MSNEDARWPGVIDASFFKDSHIENINLLADMAKAGKWDDVFRLIDAEHRLTANQWRLGGKSWFTPLHQAAWIGAPGEIVDELLRRGAWRSLRNAAGERPIDILVESWSRVVGGSGQAHVITESGCVLVEEGFV